MNNFKNFSLYSVNRCLENQKGVGLIELMVSITLGLLIIAGVLQMFASSNASSIAADGASRIQENLRYAMTRIANDVSQAGNLGCYSSSYASRIGDLPNNLLTDESALRELNDYSSFISGVEGGTDGAGNEIPDDLILKYVDQSAAIPVTFPSTSTINIDTDNPNYDGLQAFETIFIGNCERSAIVMLPAGLPTSDSGISTITLNNAAAPALPLNNINPGQSNATNEHLMSNGKSLAFAYAGNTGAYAYSIGTNTDVGATSCSTASRGTCALYRRVHGVDQELVRGVHNLQVLYGFEDATGALTFVTAAGLTAANLDEIDRVRVTLSFNSIDNTPDGLITKTVTRVFGVRTVREVI